jgi:hypothetical protein
MLAKLVEAVFTPKYPKHYRGRHRISVKPAPNPACRQPVVDLAS